MKQSIPIHRLGPLRLGRGLHWFLVYVWVDSTGPKYNLEIIAHGQNQLRYRNQLNREAQKARGQKSNLPIETLGGRPGLHTGRKNLLDMLGIPTAILF